MSRHMLWQTRSNKNCTIYKRQVLKLEMMVGWPDVTFGHLVSSEPYDMGHVVRPVISVLYGWELTNISVAQLICLTMIGALTAFQACTNIVIWIKLIHLLPTYQRKFRIFKVFMKFFGQWVKIFHHLYQQWMHFQWLLSDVESLVDLDFDLIDLELLCPNSTPIHLKLFLWSERMVTFFVVNIRHQYRYSEMETWTDSTCIMRSNSNINNRFFKISFN